MAILSRRTWALPFSRYLFGNRGFKRHLHTKGGMFEVDYPIQSCQILQQKADDRTTGGKLAP